MNSISNSSFKKVPYDGYDSDLEIRRQTRVESRFFYLGSKKAVETQKIEETSVEIFSVRSRLNSKQLEFTGKSARVVVASELQANSLCIEERKPQRKQTRAGIYLQGLLDPCFEDRLGYSWSRRESVELKTVEPSSPQTVSVQYVQKASPHENHKGDCRVDFSHSNSDLFLKDQSIGSYGEISEKLLSLLKKDPQKEKNFATLLLSYGKNLHAISRKEIGETLALPKEEVYPLLVQWVNDLSYLLFVKEIARRKKPEDSVRDLPFAVSLIRSLKLVEEGVIPLRDVLSSDAPFGSFTGVNLGSDLGMKNAQLKIRRINRLYASLIPTVDLKEKSKDSSKKASRQMRIKKELIQVFGTPSDQDVSSSSEEE